MTRWRTPSAGRRGTYGEPVEQRVVEVDETATG